MSISTSGKNDGGSLKKKYSKYEEVLIKSLLATEVLANCFFNEETNDRSVNWRQEVEDRYNAPDFDGDEVFARFITSYSYDNYKNREPYKRVDFIPQNVEIDQNAEKRFATAGAEENSPLSSWTSDESESV